MDVENLRFGVTKTSRAVHAVTKTFTKTLSARCGVMGSEAGGRVEILPDMFI